MCDVCLQHPCHPRCPNAPEPSEPPYVTECLNCGEKIYDGDYYYDIDGEEWCEECIKECRKTAEVGL